MVPLWPWWWEAPGGSSYEWVGGISGGACARTIGPITAAQKNMNITMTIITPGQTWCGFGGTGPRSA
jgi:hypothetical protein